MEYFGHAFKQSVIFGDSASDFVIKYTVMHRIVEQHEQIIVLKLHHAVEFLLHFILNFVVLPHLRGELNLKHGCKTDNVIVDLQFKVILIDVELILVQIFLLTEVN